MSDARTAVGSNQVADKRLINKEFYVIGSGGVISNSRNLNFHDIFFDREPVTKSPGRSAKRRGIGLD